MAVLHFLEAKNENRVEDAIVRSRAAGFLGHLQTFQFYFLLTLIVELFDRIEILNKELQ